ncbi:ABC transporter permease [Bifidobacterium pseudolongum]|uniref:ABC transporter permease n=1 Tax=Bifidobacterium pseudolongum TaxID=1694 RepID=UPI001D09B58F|nr:ABC transporter permease [Bifidobacterium pseudolongum]UDL23221.1 ABC transporter permease [Bifidobacterium pseudolongum]
MLIVRNALHNVVRNKGRNALMIIIIAIITAAAAVALAIVQAAERARTSALDDTTISAQISIDHGVMIGKTRDAQSGGADMQAMRESMASKQLTLDDYQKYDKSEYGVASSYYTETASAAAVDGGVEPVDSNGTMTGQESQSTTEQNQSGEQPQSPGDDRAGGMPDAGGGKGGMMMTTGDFSLVGFSSDEAIANAPNGSFTMDSGQVFGYGTDDDGDVIISKTLADANDLAVGDTFKVADITDDTTTYTFTIVGIYRNTAENTMPMGGPMASTASDPANAIYTSVSTLDTLGLTSGKTIEVTDARGDTRETQAAQLSYTYVFDGKAQYDRFVADVKANGLGDEYTVSSADVEQYEASLVPLNNLAKFAKTLLIVVLCVGAIVLVVLTIFNIRERKYEIGVLTAIGVKKAKVAAQFAIELLAVTAIGLALGVGVGAAVSVPVSNSLLTSQVEAQATQQQQQRAQFGRDMQPPSGVGQDGATTGEGSLSEAPKKGNGAPQQWGHATQMVSKVNATVNWATIGWMLLIGIGLTLLASLVAAVFVMRYEPLQILADRS